MTIPQTWFCRINCVNSHLLVKVTDVSFFIYVVAHQPSSYKELLSRQRLMLKKIVIFYIIFEKMSMKFIEKFGKTKKQPKQKSYEYTIV